MRLKTLATALVAFLVCTGYVSAASCQYYDLCQDSQQADLGASGSKDQGGGTPTDGCHCLCHFLTFVSVDSILAVSSDLKVITTDYLGREDKLVPGPVARIDHPPQLA